VVVVTWGNCVLGSLLRIWIVLVFDLPGKGIVLCFIMIDIMQDVSYGCIYNGSWPQDSVPNQYQPSLGAGKYEKKKCTKSQNFQ
jgi:hypothetical protein